MSGPSDIQDRNHLAVIVSQLLGVLFVIITVSSQQGPLHSGRPTGTQNQPAAKEDQNKDRFARLWEDPLEDQPTFAVGALGLSASPTATLSPTATPSATSSPTAAPSQTPSPSATPSPTGTSLPTTLPAGTPSRSTSSTVSRSTSASSTPTPSPSTVMAPSVVLVAPQNQGLPRRGLLSLDVTQSQKLTAIQGQGNPAQPPRPCSDSIEYKFLWNIVDGRPLPDSKELRLRIRYALVSAILADGYLPLRDSVLSPLFKPESKSSSVGELIGRFETFFKPSSNATSKCYVSVIWTPQQSQSIKLPVAEKTLELIKGEVWAKDIGDVTPKSIRGEMWFLHHGSSDDFANFAAPSPTVTATPSPTVTASSSPTVTPPSNIAFVRATIPFKDLLNPPTPEWGSLQKITTDDRLIQSLVDELSLRIPALNVQRKSPRVVVFTESDTTYSRAMIKELFDKLQVEPEIYSYLQALDGRRDEPRVPESGGTSKSQETTASLLQQKAISETDLGSSQFDYLRRAALDLKANQDRRGDVVAVGVLGSDIYDKLLVLQAVRPVLPAAVFFTTDLDAAYLERDKEPFTRNLVVASADDLEISAGDEVSLYGWTLPPMRDSYQTVLVREVRNILRWNGSHAPPNSVCMFEIAPGKSVALTDAAVPSLQLWWLAQRWFNPLIFFLGLLNAFLILWAATSRDETDLVEAPMKIWGRCLVSGEIIVAVVFFTFLLVRLTLWNLIGGKSDSFWDEPLNLGISIWPSIMIRALAFGVAILLLCLASKSFVLDCLPQQRDLNKALDGIKVRSNKFAHLLHSLFGRMRHPRNLPQRSKGFGKFSEELFEVSRLRWWVLTLSFLYLLASSVLFLLWQPTVPGRGGRALLTEKIVLASGVTLYVIHLMYCLYLHGRAFQLLHAISFYFEHEHTSRSPVDPSETLTSLGKLTTVIGRTLLYPLTVLILIILSRLKIFDNWVMTPSLTITFTLGAIVLVAASLILWWQGVTLKRVVLGQSSLYEGNRKSIEALNNGVFAAWYNQPIFAAVLSGLAVFGSLSIAQPLTQLFRSPF